jgi:hypothetical protein
MKIYKYLLICLLLNFSFQINPKNEAESNDFKDTLSKFNTQIQNFFKEKMPEENFSSMQNRLMHKLTEYFQSERMGEEAMKLFGSKFNDISTNITKYLNEEFSFQRNELSSRREQFRSFLDKIGDYFKSNFTCFRDYLENLSSRKKEKIDKSEENLPEELRYIFHYHEHYYYYPEHMKFRTCTGSQIDKCHHKCIEQKKVLCGCYIIEEEEEKTKAKDKGRDRGSAVDCVCADSVTLCGIKHTHTELKKEGL